MKKTTFLIKLLLCCLTVIFTLKVSALNTEENFLWENPASVQLDNSRIAFSEKEYGSGKIDSIYLMCYFNEGWILSINFFHFKAWFANKWAVQLILVKPDGTSQNLNYDLNPARIISHKDKLYVSDGVNTIEGSGRVYTVDLNFKKISCSIRFENILNGWSPSLLQEKKQEKAFVERLVVLPWAGITGWLKADGPKMDVHGQGYADKTLTVDPMSRLNPFLHVMRVFDDITVPDTERLHINFLTAAASSTPGSVRVPYLIIARGDQWLLVSQHYSLEPADYRVHTKSGYTYPARITISCQENGYRLEGVYTCHKLASYVDILDDIPAWARFFVSLFFKRPVKFYYTGVFNGTLTLPDGSRESLSLKGPYTYVVLK